ncbi:helix-turn-helix domain-containing protein [Actinomadura sp. NPDC048955]|uniref:helix-turn-helix domain-containing protein n=1 Tax=Actinomadura sp. NPDC048955 TaxID=3158228 RepID=UPI0033EF1E60
MWPGCSWPNSAWPRGGSCAARGEAAAHLLTGTTLTVETIAARCGFGSEEALRQAFRGLYGVSPSHYRATQSTTR